MKNNMIWIESEKLRFLLKEKGLKMAAVSRECGFSDSYLKNCINNKRIPKRTSILLEKVTGIALDEYEAKVEKVEEQPKPVAKAIDILTADELKILIFNAVTDALKERFA